MTQKHVYINSFNIEASCMYTFYCKNSVCLRNFLFMLDAHMHTHMIPWSVCCLKFWNLNLLAACVVLETFQWSQKETRIWNFALPKLSAWPWIKEFWNSFRLGKLIKLGDKRLFKLVRINFSPEKPTELDLAGEPLNYVFKAGNILLHGLSPFGQVDDLMDKGANGSFELLFQLFKKKQI